MVGEGLPLNITGFNPLIHGTFTSGYWEKAEILLVEMMNRGIHPYTVFNTINHLPMQRKYVIEAQNIFDLIVPIPH
jgi:pentatricopeptide repeat protein